MKPLGIAVIMGEDLEETLGWAKDSGFHNCQLQLWDMSHLRLLQAAQERG